MSTFQLGSPMWRLTERIVRSTFVTACRLATSPTRTSPFLANATTLGVVREPSEFAMTSGSPPDRTETTELVVPRSIPTARAMVELLLQIVQIGLVRLRDELLPLAPMVPSGATHCQKN